MKKISAIAVLVLCIAAASVSCRRINTLFEEETVAKVGDAKLYMSEVRTIFTPDLTPQDSMKLLERYVDAWVKRQLKIQKAEEIFPEAIPEVERMVEDYRSSLLSYRLDQYYVDRRIDTLVTAEEVEVYYNGHLSDFVLDRSIVKGIIVKLPDNHRQKVKVRELMVGSGEKYQDFLELSRKNGFSVYEVASWMDFADFLNMLPTNKLRDYDDLLGKTGVQEMKDGDNLYLIVISSHMKAGETSPPERVGETIRRVIMNQRRQDIVRNYEDSIYNAGLGSKLVEIKIHNGL